MNHPEVYTFLSAFVDHELSASEETLVNAHIGTCAECRRRINELVTLKRNVHAAGNIELPYAFANSLTRSIHHNAEVDGSWVGIEHYAQKFVIGLAMLVLLLIGLTTIKQNEEPFPVERYVSGLTSDSAASQILTKHGSVTREDVLIAVLTK